MFSKPFASLAHGTSYPGLSEYFGTHYMLLVIHATVRGQDKHKQDIKRPEIKNTTK